jgi:hypothetical protein
MLPLSLRDFDLTYDRHTPSDHSFPIPSLLDETDKENNDRLSLALHILSRRLACFALAAEVGPEVMWPSGPTVLNHRHHHHHQQQQQEQQQQKQHQREDEDKPSVPFWPIMKHYSIDPGAIAPSGEWRFRQRTDGSEYSIDSPDSEYSGPPGDEISYQFREEHDLDVVGPLLLAVARAAGQMPALRDMHFSLSPPVGSDNWLKIWYDVTDNGPPPLDHGRRGARLIVECEPAFYPDKETMQAWRETAKGHTGTESSLEVLITDYKWVPY